MISQRHKELRKHSYMLGTQPWESTARIALYAEENYYAVVAVRMSGSESNDEKKADTRQTGIAASCIKYATPIGVGYNDSATQQGVTQAQWHTSKPVLGTIGVSCGIAFWGRDHPCVEVGG